jgi:hypothetical protein
MKAAPLVEQHALRAFEHDGARPRESVADASALAGGDCRRHGAAASSQRCESEASSSIASSPRLRHAARPHRAGEFAAQRMRDVSSFSKARAGDFKSP